VANQRTTESKQTRQPDIDNFDDLVTEDDEPVDNIFSEKQQRLLTESLYNGWKPEQSFLTLANVGLFYLCAQQTAPSSGCVIESRSQDARRSLEKTGTGVVEWECFEYRAFLTNLPHENEMNWPYDCEINWF
jgi:hypothetical protein